MFNMGPEAAARGRCNHASDCPSRFQCSRALNPTQREPVGQPPGLPGQGPGPWTPPPRNCLLLPFSWAQSLYREMALDFTSGQETRCGRFYRRPWAHPKLVHLWAVGGHVVCLSCGWTMNILWLQEARFHQEMSQQWTSGVLMTHPASWEAIPSPRTFLRRAGESGVIKAQQETHWTGLRLLKREREIAMEQGPRAGNTGFGTY